MAIPGLRSWLRVAVLSVTLDRAAAEATTTFTPPVRNATGDDLTCFAQNHTGLDVEVTAVLRDETGAALNSFTTDVPPGRASLISFSDTPVAEGYCQFDFEGDDAAVRGFILLSDDGGSGARVLLEASEPRGAARPGVVTHSPPVLTSAADRLACVAQNLGVVAVEVEAEIRDHTGAVVASASAMVGGRDAITIVGADDPPGSNSCRFSFDGNPSLVRGFVRLTDTMGGNTRFLAAAAEIGGAPAARLHAPPIVPTGGTVRCLAQNLSAQTVPVEAVLLDDDGVPIGAPAEIELPPGHVEYLLATAIESPAAVSCRFDLGATPAGLRAFTALTEPLAGATRLLQPATGTGGTIGLGATSYTATVRNDDGDDIECWVQNVGADAVAIDAAVVSLLGTVLDDVETSVPAGAVRRVLVSNQLLTGLYCRFTFDGSPADVRGSIVRDDGSPRILQLASIALPLTPAPTATRTRTSTPTPTATRTATPTATPTASRTATAAFTRTAAATASHTPTASATNAPTATSTAVPTTADTPVPTITAAASTASPTPAEATPSTPGATPSATPVTPGFPGDANCDGFPSAPDLSAVAAAIGAGAAPACGEDANEDGVVDERDADRILALIFGAG